LKEFNEGAVTISIGKLFQMFVTLLQRNTFSCHNVFYDYVSCSTITYLRCVTSCYQRNYWRLGMHR